TDQRPAEPHRTGEGNYAQGYSDSVEPALHSGPVVIYWPAVSVSSPGIMTSTRRFLALPSGVLLSAMGSSSPLPSTVIRDGSVISGVRIFSTDLARASDSS